MKTNDATRYLVIGLRSDGFKVESVWDNEGAARNDAETLARGNDGLIYGVFQKLATATLTHVVEWKGASR